MLVRPTIACQTKTCHTGIPTTGNVSEEGAILPAMGGRPSAAAAAGTDLADSRGMVEAQREEQHRIARPIDVLRECDGWDLVRRSVAGAEPGDLVLVDGSLHGGPLVPPEVIRSIHRAAVDRGVHLAGVVKASTLFWGRNAPLVGLLKRRGDRELGRGPLVARISTDPVFQRVYVGEIFVTGLPGSPATRWPTSAGPSALPWPGPAWTRRRSRRCSRTSTRC